MIYSLRDAVAVLGRTLGPLARAHKLNGKISITGNTPRKRKENKICM
jgi:hypothetical protein